MQADWKSIACAFAAFGATGALAKPVAFTDGTTITAEYGAGTMREVQAFSAPHFRYSVGVGHLALESHVSQTAASGGHSHGAPLAGSSSQPTHDITYLRVNYLPKRWNMESAQANVFVWGGVGQLNMFRDDGEELAWNAGGQVDYETRRIYASLRTDLHEAGAFRHRIDTVQLGIAPYEHDYGTLAVWFVIQARQYAGELIHDGTEVSALLRLFRRKTWIEAGVTQDGRAQAMVMFNF